MTPKVELPRNRDVQNLTNPIHHWPQIRLRLEDEPLDELHTSALFQVERLPSSP